MFLWKSLAFSIIQQMLAIWSLVLLPFLNPIWTSGSSWWIFWILAGSFFFFNNLWTDVPQGLRFRYACSEKHGEEIPKWSTVLRDRGSCVDPYQDGGLLSSPYGMQTEQEVTFFWSEFVLSPNFQCWISWVFFNLSHRAFYYLNNNFCCLSVTQSCLTLCDPINCSMPG